MMDPYFQEATETMMPSTDTATKVLFVLNYGVDDGEKAALMFMKLKQRLVIKCRMSFQ